MLLVQNLDIDVHGRRLLTQAELFCRPRSSIAIVGPSGSGKTTLLHTISGILRHQSGRIVIDGTDTSTLSSRKMSDFRLHHIGMVFQFPELFPELSALENAALVLRLQGMGRKSAQGIARSWLERLGVGDWAETSAATLSGGEAQRVGIARAFAGKPSLVLADEPTGSLDEAEVSRVASVLIQAAKDTDAALVVVTHNPLVARMTDLTLEIVRGTLVPQSGRPWANRMIWRVALGLATARSPTVRWRQVSVPICAGVALFLNLSAIALFTMVRAEHARLAARTGVVSFAPSESDLFVLERDDSWQGEQYVVYWLQPASSGRTVLPPGLTRLPELGEVALSPALVKLRSHESELAHRYPRWFTIEQDGIVSAEEMIAYARAPDDPGIRSARSAIRISSFGRNASAQNRPLVLEALPNLWPIALASVALIVIPAALVAGTAASGASSIRERRFRVLARVGAPLSVLRTIAALEAATLAVPGALVGLTLWLAASHTIASIPGIQRAVFRSDLSLGALILGVSTSAVVLWTGAVSALTTRVSLGPRSAGSRWGPSWRLGPLLLGSLAAAYGAVTAGEHGAIIFLVGVLVVLGSNVVLAPVLIRWAGSLLGSSGRLVLQFAGRRMEHSPERWARPFVATGILAVLACIIVGQIAILSQQDPNRPHSGVAVATVRWIHQSPRDFIGFRDVLHESYAFPAKSDGPEVRIGAACAELAPIFMLDDCIPTSPYWLSESAAASVSGALGMRSVSITLVDRDQLDPIAEAVVFARSDVRSLHEQLRTAGMLSLTAPTVVSEVTSNAQPSPMKAWLVAGLFLAGLTLGLSAVVTAIDRSLGASTPRLLLMRIGVSRNRVRNFESAVFGASFATVVGSSALLGILISSFTVRQTAAAVPVATFALLVAGFAVFGTVGTGLLWLFHRASPGDLPDD